MSHGLTGPNVDNFETQIMLRSLRSQDFIHHHRPIRAKSDGLTIPIFNPAQINVLVENQLIGRQVEHSRLAKCRIDSHHRSIIRETHVSHVEELLALITIWPG